MWCINDRKKTTGNPETVTASLGQPFQGRCKESKCFEVGKFNNVD